jgi:gliding motility-associated-like protein
MKNRGMKCLGVLIGFWISFFSPVSVRAQCPNLDFSLANFSYWQSYIGTWRWSSGIGETININPSAATVNRQTIMDLSILMPSQIKDEKCNLINKVPNGFNYSAKLGNSYTGAQMEALEYTLNVDSNNSLLILHFAWVMENPNHTQLEQPRFSMKIKDTLDNLITSSFPNIGCVDVDFIASGNLPNLACSTYSVVARNWTTVGFSLEALVGQKIKIYFETRDCSQGGHFGYAYMVGECRPMAIGLMYCEGHDTAYLSAPDGFVNYKWTRSSQSTWGKEGSDITCKNLVIADPVDGEKFTCELSSEMGSECSAILNAIIARTSLRTDFLYGVMENGGVDIAKHDSVCWYDTCSRTATFVNLSYIKNSKESSILWEIPALNAVSNDSLFTYTFPDADTAVDYLVRLTVTTTSGCVDVMERNIMIYPMPKINNIDNSSLCAGTRQTFNFVNPTINIDSSVWTNSNPDIGLDTIGTGDISFIATNTETTPLTSTITITLKSDLGCIGETETFTLTVNPLPQMDQIEDITLCSGASQTIHFTGTNINLDSSTWTNDNPAIGLDTSGTGHISFTATNTGTTPLTATITMTPKSDLGCTNETKIFTITVYPTPEMDHVDDNTLCAGENQTTHFTGKNIDPDSSVWTNSNPDIGLATNGNGHISFTTVNNQTSPITGVITMTPISNGCIGKTETFTVTVNPSPQMEYTGDISLCNGTYQAIHFTGENINLDSSTWTNDNPAIGLDTGGTGHISFTATNPGTTPLIATVTMTPKSNFGCANETKIFTITVYPTPEMDHVKDDTLCVGENQTIHFTGKNINPDSSVWTNSNPDIGLATNGNGHISFITANRQTSSITGIITMTPISNEGCAGEPQTVNMTIHPEIHIHAIVNDSMFCKGDNVAFEVVNQHELNNILWTGPDSFSSSIANFNILDASPDNTGTYFVNAMTKDNCNAIPVSISIVVFPEVFTDMEDTLFTCHSKVVLYSNATNANKYLWNTGEITKNITVSSPGTYWVHAMNQRCQTSDTVYVIETDIPAIEIYQRGDLCQDGVMILYVDQKTDNLSYRWTTGDSTDQITIHQNGVYGIYVFIKGCTTLQNIKIECQCDFWKPNMITINGDNLNEYFLPVPTSQLNSFSMFIYDRWDNLMFYTDTYAPWHGTNNGLDAVAGTYVYVIHYSCADSPDKKRKIQGKITLMR